MQPPANPADEHAEDGGAEDDEDPRVDDGVHGEKPQGAEVGVLVEIGSKGPHVRSDLSKNPTEIGKNEERSHYGGKAESKKIPRGAEKEVLTPRYLYASNQPMLWVADPETGSWGWVTDGRGTASPCPQQGQEVRAEDLVPGIGSFME